MLPSVLFFINNPIERFEQNRSVCFDMILAGGKFSGQQNYFENNAAGEKSKTPGDL